MPDLRSHVFISYARADGDAAARTVEHRLEKRGFRVWRDVRSLDPEADFSVEIETAIAGAAAVVLCITPSLDRHDSFLRREILYAQAKQRRIIPLRVAHAAIPVLVTHLTYIDAALDDEAGADATVEAVVGRLREDRPSAVTRQESASRAAYLAALYDDIVAHLRETVRKLLTTTAITSAAAMPMRRTLPATFRSVVVANPPTAVAPSLTDADFGARFRHERQAIVLHGRPGAGKTTRLMTAARDAVLAVLEDPSEPLPVVVRAADWNVEADEPIEAWLGRSTPLLAPDQLHAACEREAIVLFVDGLDELGPVRVLGDGTTFDPRARLLALLPERLPVLLTSRPDGLTAVAARPRYRVAELQPLGEDQVRAYVADLPQLRDLLDAEPALRELARTPLNLGLLAVAVVGERVPAPMAADSRALEGQLLIIKAFVERRYAHECLSPAAAPMLPFAAIEAVLGRVATQQGGSFSFAALEAAATPETVPAVDVEREAVRLGYLRTLPGAVHQFFHPLFDDYFAFLHCHKYLGVQSEDGWDNRLFYRIARLGDPSFMAPLTALADSPGFWPGEFGDQIAVALEGISALQPGLEDAAVDAFVTLASRRHVEGYDGIRAVAAFARRVSDGTRPRLIEALALIVRGNTHASLEAIHQLVQLGPEGIDVLIAIAAQPQAGMRGQILSYVAVTDRIRRLGG